jgi:hypothetical protein
MTDPAVAFAPGDNYGSYDRGTELDIWLKSGDGKNYSLGVIWPGKHLFSLRITSYLTYPQVSLFSRTGSILTLKSEDLAVLSNFRV